MEEVGSPRQPQELDASLAGGFAQDDWYRPADHPDATSDPSLLNEDKNYSQSGSKKMRTKTEYIVQDRWHEILRPV